MFSPRVSSPLTKWPFTGLKLLYCATSCLVFLAKFLWSALVHQSRKLPSPSYWAPWSSKPWLISWPMTPPMAP
ncbi:hypothetical protein D3C72_2353330 [compost metagenome]